MSSRYPPPCPPAFGPEDFPGSDFEAVAPPASAGIVSSPNLFLSVRGEEPDAWGWKRRPDGRMCCPKHETSWTDAGCFVCLAAREKAAHPDLEAALRASVEAPVPSHTSTMRAKLDELDKRRAREKADLEDSRIREAIARNAKERVFDASTFFADASKTTSARLAEELNARLKAYAERDPGAPVATKPTNPKDAISGSKVPARSVVPAQVVNDAALALLEGARKYGRHNYRIAGVRASVYIDATGHHLDSWWEGEDIDPDSGLSHVTKAIASLVVLRDSMMQGNWTDDRPPKAKPGWMARANAETVRIVRTVRPDDPVEACTEVGVHAPAPTHEPLLCPWCGKRHIDEGEFATRLHHTHRCVGDGACGKEWRLDRYVFGAA